MPFTRGSLLTMVLLVALITPGCATAKGVKSDTSVFFDKIKKADAWFSEEVW